MMFMQIASAVVYMVSLLLLHEYFDLQYIDGQFMIKVCFIVIVSWLPFQILYCLINTFDPSENTKIMAHKKERKWKCLC